MFVINIYLQIKFWCIILGLNQCQFRSLVFTSKQLVAVLIKKTFCGLGKFGLNHSLERTKLSLPKNNTQVKVFRNFTIPHIHEHGIRFQDQRLANEIIASALALTSLLSIAKATTTTQRQVKLRRDLCYR